MGTLELLMAKIMVKILDILTYNLKNDINKITYISYISDKLTEDMKMISDEINKSNENIKEVYLILKYKNTILDKLRYVVEIIKQVYHIKTSNVVIIDGNNFVVSNINKKNTKIVQIWHACGAIKKFGEDFERKYKIKNYDYIITSSSKSKSIMASAFGVDEDQVIPLGYPKTDKLFDKKIMRKYKLEMYKKYPFLKGKKIVLYAPTFRGEGIYDKKFLKVDIDKISKSIGDDYVFLYKFHPVIDNKLDCKVENVKDVSDESLYKLFSVADMLVSDFSAIIYDFSILEKPILLYTPDLDEYKEKRGLYVDYEEFAPGKITYNEDELIKSIQQENFNIQKVKKIKNEFFDFLDGKSSVRIAKFIRELLK